jgi:hypothetical protein
LPVSRIFISHSSTDNAPAIALRDWLVGEGWDDLFLDLDPERGIAAGERWERALNEAARQCEVVLFLMSKAWLTSRWCMNEMNLARRLNKRLFGILIEEGLAISDLPADVTSKWQVINLAAGSDHGQFPVTLPITGELATPTFSREGLARLKSGLQRAGLAASWFAWPPEHDRNRSPYRGLKPLEAEDSGIFFGREAPTIEAIDRLRGMCEAAPPRMFVILGASGAGKSSFLQAGLLPRLGRENRTFLPLPVIRPGRTPITGETGFLRALESAFVKASLKTARAELRAAIEGGASKLKPMLSMLAAKVVPAALEGEAERKPSIIVIAIDQGEELFLAEAQDEAKPFLALLRDLLASDAPAMIAVFTIRSDNYERLQQATELADIHKLPLDLGPMPRGSYAEVIRGPARRLDGTSRAFKIDDALVDALLADVEAGGAKDALPLLAFTLERLYGEYGATAHLKLEQYEKLGRVKGSISAAIEHTFKIADGDSRIPKDRQVRLALLRRGLIPWLAGMDPDTGAPRRRVARLSEIPVQARPLVDLLVDQRLLSTDIAKDTNENTVEPAHEALLRQWGLLQGWLAEDAGLLSVMDGIKRASRDWAANGKKQSWLVHGAERLRAAEQLLARPDLTGPLEPTDNDYVTACQLQDRAYRQRIWRRKVLLGTFAAITPMVLLIFIVFVTIQWNRFEEWPKVDLIGGDIALDLINYDASESHCFLRCIFDWSCVAFSFSYNPRTRNGVCYSKEDTLFIDTSSDAETSTSYYFPGAKPVMSPFKIDWGLLYFGDPIKPNGDPADPTDDHNRERNDRYKAWGYRISELDKLPGAAPALSHKNAGIRCQKMCADQPKCLGFTYNGVYQRCKLFGAVKDWVRIPAYDPSGITTQQLELNIPTVISGCRDQACPKY